MFFKRKFDRRISFRLTLLLPIVALMLSTAITIGVVSWINLQRSVIELFEARFAELADNVGDRVRLLLRPADDILKFHVAMAARGVMHPDNYEEMGDRLASELYFINDLSWLSYGDRKGNFVGARREEDRRIILNRSWVGPDGIGAMNEWQIHANGTRTLVRNEPQWAYDPRDRGWYKAAVESHDPIWTEPYEWFGAEGKGITCAYALRDPNSDEVKGVFTADYRLVSLSDFLNSLRLTEIRAKSAMPTTAPAPSRMQAFILNNKDGSIIASPDRDDVRAMDPRLIVAMEKLRRPLNGFLPHESERVDFEFEGEGFSAGFEAFEVQDKTWITAVVVPHSELLGNVRNNSFWTIVVSALSIAISVILANILAKRLSRPLTQIADDLEAVGQFRLSNAPAPESRVREIHIVGQAAEKMKASLRSFGRYVPQNLVRQLLAHGEEAHLGAQSKPVTIQFSDIEGFSRIAERVAPDSLVEMLSQYLDRMTQIIESNKGTLDKFIGDGVLAFFNAPDPIPDHAAKACNSAIDAQLQLAEMNRQWVAGGKPAFITRVGLHTAEVLVGNIGTSSRFAYTVMGDGVNLASGMETLNKLYGTRILATHETFHAAGPGFEWRRIDRVAVKGRKQGGDVFELLGRKGEVPPRALEIRDVYEKALDAYRNRDFKKAVDLFDVLLTITPNDRATQIMMNRAQGLLFDPPPVNWDSMYVHGQV